MCSRRWARLLVLLPLGALAGCISLAPDYTRPDAPVPDHWPAASSEAGASQAQATHKATPKDKGAQGGLAAAQVPYREFIRDPRLVQVVDLALEQSRSLRATAQAVLSARALYAGQDAARWPSLNGEGTATWGRTVNAAFGSAVAQERYQIGLAMPSFELDLFGRLANLAEAAEFQALASVEAYRASRIALIGEVSLAWVALAADQARLALAEQTAANAQRAVDLTQKRQQGGLASRVDLRQAEITLQGARADIALYTTAVAQDRNALEWLVGHAVADPLLPDPLAGGAVWFAEVPTGLPSEVLLTRPDVMQAEHALQAAHANIGAARAAFFPSLSLTASGGLATTAISSLTSGDMSKVWTVAPTLSVPIFDAGRNAANLDYQESEQQRLLSSYELAIQTAFREVADALVRRDTILDQVQAHDAQVEAANDNYALSEARYRKGVDAYLLTLDAQRTLYQAQQLLISSRETQLNNLVTLYRVLGGGLAEPEEASSPGTQLGTQAGQAAEPAP